MPREDPQGAPPTMQPNTDRPHFRAQSSVRTRGAFTIVEMLAVVGVIAVLLAILLPALGIARRNTLWATSQANLREVGQMLILYAGDNRETIVPTAFDYRTSLAPGKVRTSSPPGLVPPLGAASYGSWCDILWTTGGFGPIASIKEDDSSPQWDYRYDSPDAALYATGWSGQNIFRSAEQMKTVSGGDGATPFGTGTTEDEKGDLGYFGGNPFFDARPPATDHPYSGNYWVTGQIKRPEASMYCCDSSVGELLGVNVPNYTNTTPGLNLTGVEYRYTGDQTLMLFLDGHVDSFGEWDTMYELEKDLGVRVLGLDRRSYFPNP